MKVFVILKCTKSPLGLRPQIGIMAFLFMISFLGCALNHKKSGFEIGSVPHIRSLSVNKKIIPESVKKEAAEPTITNPYSGNSFSKKEIGTYNPEENFFYSDMGVYVKYTVPTDFIVSPYVKVGIQYPLGASTKDGEQGKGYSYSKVLGGGADFVRYVYGIEYEYPYWVEPEAGITIGEAKSLSLSVGTSWQKLHLSFFKAIEAWGTPRHFQRSGSAWLNLINYKASLAIPIYEAKGFLDLGFSLSTFDHEEIVGYGGMFTLRIEY